MSAEPTAEQLAQANAMLAEWHDLPADYDMSFHPLTTTIARALAAAVTAEQEKLRQAALDFDRRSDRSAGDRSAAFAEAAARLHFLAGDPA